MKNLPLQKNKGYTLLETLVAVMVLTLSLVAPMSIASKVLISSSIAREQVTAFYLAQEAIEGVRFIRDQNGLSGVDWRTGMPVLGTSFTIDSTTFDGTGKPVVSACSGACNPIKYDSASHLFQYTSGSDTSFTRTVTLNSVAGTSDEISVTVVVSWSVGKFNRSFTARENIFNWQ